jgi:hypothetical protein
MLDVIPNPDPLGLPIPVPILLVLKVFGFFLHMVFMNLWLAGLPTALVLVKRRPLVAKRLFESMPFFMAFGINAGIVPLLFIQTLYPQFFYPATILQAWFWFLIIPLLLIAYYGVYLAAFGRLRIIAGLGASLLLTWIGLTFSAAMSLTAAPEKWPSIFLATADAASVHGAFLHLEWETLLRYLLVLGMAFGTVAVFMVLDSHWLTNEQELAAQVRHLVLPLYGLGLAIYGTAGSLYSPMVVDKLPRFWWSLAGGSMPIGVLLAAAYSKWGSRWTGVTLVIVHIVVLLSNAIARQIVQFRDLQRWVDLEKIPVRGEWGSFFLFVITLMVVLGVIVWIARTSLLRMRPAG